MEDASMSMGGNREDDMFTFRPEMISFGYTFAKKFGGPFHKNELVENLNIYTKCLPKVMERMGGEVQYTDFIVQEMLNHKMIFEEGQNLIWNPDYLPREEDIWHGWEEFTDAAEE